MENLGEVVRYKFCVLIPSRGRKEIIDESLEWLEKADRNDLIIVISNNNTEPYFYEGPLEVRVISPNRTLEMWENWNFGLEFCVEQIKFDYLLLSTDKCFNTASTFSFLDHVIGKGVDVVTWSFGPLSHRVIDCKHPYVSPDEFNGEIVQELSGYELLHDFLRGDFFSFERAPLGANSAISAARVREIVDHFGRACWPVNPDYTLAFLVLNLSEVRLKHISARLNLLRYDNGKSVGNGSAIIRGDKSGARFLNEANKSFRSMFGDDYEWLSDDEFGNTAFAIVYKDFLALQEKFDLNMFESLSLDAVRYAICVERLRWLKSGVQYKRNFRLFLVSWLSMLRGNAGLSDAFFLITRFVFAGSAGASRIIWRRFVKIF